MRTNRRQSGFALLLVMMVVVAASILGMSYLSGATVMLACSGNLASASRAKYLAECGVQHAMEVLATNVGSLGGSQGNPLGPYYADAGSDRYFLYAVADGPRQYILGGIGYVGAAKQRASATVQFPCFASLVMEHEPLGYWRLGEGWGGTAVDYTGRNNGQYFDVELGMHGAVNGEADTAVRCNGTSSRIPVADDPFDFTSSFSVSAWVRVPETAPSNVIAGNLRSSKGWLARMKDTRLMLMLDDKNWKSHADVLGVGRWLHVVVVYDDANDRVSFYVNGANVGTRTGVSKRPSPNDRAMELGHQPEHGSNYLRGRLDEVAIFDYALLPSQAASLYRAGRVPMRLIKWND